MGRMRPTRSVPVVALLGLALGPLAACSGGGDEEQPAEATASATPGPGDDGAGATAYLEVPDGVELTAQGEVLDVGEQATVAWEPRAGTTGALDVAVTEVVRAPLSVFRGWQLDAAAKESAAYFVTAEVTNVGEADLSGVPVPLYAVDGSMVLVQPSSFDGRFRPCPSGPFPDGFAPGATEEVCQVYLLADEGDLTGVVFRPTEAFVPITWSGVVGEYDDPDDERGRDRRDGDRRGGDRRGGGAGEQSGDGAQER